MYIVKLIAQILYFGIKIIRHYYYIITDEKKERKLGEYDGRSHRKGIPTHQSTPKGKFRTEEKVRTLRERVEENQYRE